MAAPHVSSISALVLQAYPGLKQGTMETILKDSARGLPLPACDAVVAYPFEEPYYYIARWNGGDWGAGFLQADAVLRKAKQMIK
jgi:hypothetical protein